jgi:hypothetical protein
MKLITYNYNEIGDIHHRIVKYPCKIITLSSNAGSRISPNVLLREISSPCKRGSEWRGLSNFSGILALLGQKLCPGISYFTWQNA